MKRFTWLILTALLALPTAALAQVDYSRVIELTPTKEGLALGAHGKACIEITQKGVEVFTIAASADVPNRSYLALEVTTWKGTYSIGGLRMTLGMGTLDLWSTIDPAAIFPVAEVTGVVLYEGKTAILEGTFEKF